MRRLETRISRLEQRLPACAECASRRAAVAFECPGRLGQWRRPGVCRSCGEPLEQIRIRLAWDPHRAEEAP